MSSTGYCVRFSNERTRGNCASRSYAEAARGRILRFSPYPKNAVHNRFAKIAVAIFCSRPFCLWLPQHFFRSITYAREHFLFTLQKKHFGSHRTAKSFFPLTPKLFARTQSGRVIFISTEEEKVYTWQERLHENYSLGFCLIESAYNSCFILIPRRCCTCTS